jgi:hypothetical protein
VLPAAREARTPLRAADAPVVELLDEADDALDLREEADESVDVEAPSGAGRGFVRTATWRQGRVPYLLQDVIVARHEVERADRQLAKRVRSAREHGASWEDIGVALGMSRQGASKRFG